MKSPETKAPNTKPSENGSATNGSNGSSGGGGKGPELRFAYDGSPYVKPEELLQSQRVVDQLKALQASKLAASLKGFEEDRKKHRKRTSR